MYVIQSGGTGNYSSNSGGASRQSMTAHRTNYGEKHHPGYDHSHLTEEERKYFEDRDRKLAAEYNGTEEEQRKLEAQMKEAEAQK